MGGSLTKDNNRNGAASAATASLTPLRAFLLLRYTLIVATAYLLLTEEGFAMPPLGSILPIVAALLSNVIIAQLPVRMTAGLRFNAAIIIFDTAWITGALLQTGRFSAEFFYLYFFVLLLAAVGENLRLIVLGAVATCVAYLYILAATGGHWSLWNSPSLIRIPFLFATAAFYGHLVDRTRHERQRADMTTEALRAEAQVSAALVRVGEEMNSSLATTVILERLCKLTAELLGCDSSHSFLWRPEEQEFVPHAQYGDTAEEWAAVQALKIPRAAITDLLARLEQQEVVHVTVAELPRTLPLHEHVVAGLYVALRHGDEVIGIHTAEYRRRAAVLTDREERIVRGIGQIASMALANAKLVEELERANRVKSEFVATMSHELRNPLSLIIGYNDLLLESAFGTPSAEQIEVMQRIARSARELLDMIQATLDLSRLEDRRVKVHLEDLRPAEFLAELNAETEQLQSESNLTFTWQAAPDLPSVRTDPVKLRMILKNLISNAVKFTDEGGVTIAVQGRDRGVEFAVTDTGIGIAPEAQAIIFEPFRQVDGSFTRRHDGAGLGLYIVRRLLELLHGTVALESTTGRGTTFRVWIPADVAQTERSAQSGAVTTARHVKADGAAHAA